MFVFQCSRCSRKWPCTDNPNCVECGALCEIIELDIQKPQRYHSGFQEHPRPASIIDQSASSLATPEFETALDVKSSADNIVSRRTDGGSIVKKSWAQVVPEKAPSLEILRPTADSIVKIAVVRAESFGINFWSALDTLGSENLYSTQAWRDAISSVLLDDTEINFAQTKLLLTALDMFPEELIRQTETLTLQASENISTGAQKLMNDETGGQSQELRKAIVSIQAVPDATTKQAAQDFPKAKGKDKEKSKGKKRSRRGKYGETPAQKPQVQLEKPEPIPSLEETTGNKVSGHAWTTVAGSKRTNSTARSLVVVHQTQYGRTGQGVFEQQGNRNDSVIHQSFKSNRSNKYPGHTRISRSVIDE